MSDPIDDPTNTPSVDPPDPATSAGTEDLNKNLKAEFNRKFAAIQTQMQEDRQLILNQIQQTQARNIPPQPAPEPDYDILDDPSKFKNDLLTEVGNMVQTTVKNTMEKESHKAVAKTQLYIDFPELQDESTEFYQIASRDYNALTPEQQKDDTHLTTIVYRTAAQLSIKPKKFRTADDNDDFTLGANRGERNTVAKKEPEKYEGIEQGAVDWMNILKEVGANVDIDKPEDLEKLQKYSKRRNWNQYAGNFKRDGGNK